MAEGPGRAGRPDDTYSVAGRIESRRSRRGQLGLVVVGVVIVVWASATLGDRLTPRQPGSSAPASLVAGGPGGSPGSEPTPIEDSGYLPSLELGPGKNVAGRLPLMLGGLAWLDLSLPRIESSVDLNLDQWDFALPYGELACVCLASQPDGGRELLLRRYGPSGNIAYANPMPDWLTPDDDLTLVDAAISPDGLAAIVASVVTERGDYRLRVERRPLTVDDPTGGSTISQVVDLAPLGDPARLAVRVLVAPDGSLIRVTLQRLADDLAGITGIERSWTVPFDAANGFGQFTEEAPVPDAVVPASCRGSAFATTRAVVALCTSLGTDAQGQSGLLLRIDRGGRYQDVDLGSIFAGGPEVVGWQVDGSHGVVYVWEAFAHRLIRIVAATGAATETVLGSGDGNELPSITPGPAPSLHEPPDPPVLWQPTGSARDVTANLLAGSADGRWLYAGGLVYPTGPGATGSLDSTGIWILDSTTLLPVAHWAAVATYQALGLSPDGSYLIGIGAPSSAELAEFGNHGPQMALHDPMDGSVIEIQRSLVLRLGGMPYLLPAGPPPPVP